MDVAYVVQREYADGGSELIGVMLTIQEARDLGAVWCLERMLGWAGWQDEIEELPTGRVWRSWMDDPQIVIYEAPVIVSPVGKYTSGANANSGREAR
jgi:hypothetical protein